jgi:hypothetical protein
LLDHLVGGGQQRFRDGEAKRLCGPTIDGDPLDKTGEHFLRRRCGASCGGAHTVKTAAMRPGGSAAAARRAST